MGKRIVLLFILALLSAVAAHAGSKAAAGSGFAGTYSTMYYNNEGGDLLGEELRIVLGKSGYKGILQFSEGRPSDPVLMDVRIEGSAISFDTPAEWDYPGHFQGTISARKVSGVLRLQNGVDVPLDLPRRAGYWDDPISK